jgi:hypothetical protein
MAMANTTTYYDMSTITAVNSFTVQDPVDPGPIKYFMAVIKLLP